MEGRFRYSDLKEAAPGDYGICIPMSRSLIVCEMALAVGAASVSVAGGRENGRGAALQRVWSAPPYSILRSGRQRTSVRAEARARFEAGDVDS